MRRNPHHLLARLTALRQAAAAAARSSAQNKAATTTTRRALAPFSSSLPPSPSPHRDHRRRAASTLAAVFDESGEPDAVLRVRELPLSRGLREVEVLLELEAAPINPSDVNTIQGRYPLRPNPPNAVPGHEGVFRVVETSGGGGSPLRPGDRVVPLRPALGTWRSSGVFNAKDWHRIPNDLPLAAAATLCVNPPTALGLLEDFVDVKAGGQAGERAPAIVAQTGATSAVGQLVIQLAHHWGAKTINVIRDRPDWDDTCAWLQAMGADLVTTEARARHDAAEAGLHAGAALALDCVGGTACASVARLLRPGGTLVSYGAMSLQPVTVPASLLIFKDIRVRGYWLSGRRRQRRGAGGDGGADEDEDLLARREMLDRAASLFLQGVWRAPPAETFPLSEVGRGVARAREGKTRTKVLLVPG